MAKEQYSNREIARVLRIAARIAGEPLSVGKYDAIRATIEGPSAIRLIQRFGSWCAACDFAGVTSGVAKRSYVKNWDQKQIVKIVRDYLAGDPKVSFLDFSRWLKGLPSAPSAATCRNVGGSWSALLALARSERGQN